MWSCSSTTVAMLNDMIYKFRISYKFLTHNYYYKDLQSTNQIAILDPIEYLSAKTHKVQALPKVVI